MIYFQTRMTSTVVGSDLKDVRCQHCGMTYHYVYRAMAKGEGVSIYGLDDDGARQRAETTATARLKKTLRNGMWPVACPGCKRLQRSMVGVLRRQFRGQWMLAGVILPSILIFFALAVALLSSDFFDNPIPSGPMSAIVALTGIAGLLYGLIGVRNCFTLRRLSTEYFGPMNVPTGTEGPAPIAAATPKTGPAIALGYRG